MKTRVFSTIALVLILAVGGLFAQQAQGPQLAFTGQVQYGGLMNFEGYGPGQFWDNQLIATASIDKFNKAVLRIRANDAAAGSAAPAAVSFNRAYIESNLAGVFGLDKAGIDDLLTVGYANPWTADLTDGVSPAGVADVSTKTSLGGGGQAVLHNVLSIMKTVNLRVLAAFDSYGAKKGGWWAAIDGGFGPVSAEVNYGIDYTTLGAAAIDNAKGVFAAAAKYDQAMGELGLAAAGNFAYDMLWEQSRFGIAAKTSYKELAALQLGFLGMTKTKLPGSKDSFANRFEARLLLTPVSVFGLDLGTVLNLDQDAYMVGTEKSILNEMDLRANVFAGKTLTFSLGYLLLGVQGYSAAIANEIWRIGATIGANSAVGKGGLYFETKLTF